MASEHSFDIVSQVDMQVLKDCINVALKTVNNRFDLKGHGNNLTLDSNSKIVTIIGDSNIAIKAVTDIFYQSLIKRNISIKAFDFSENKPIANSMIKTTATIVTGINSENIRTINKIIKESKLKLKSQTQDDKIRVTSKSINDLQELISTLRANSSIDIPLQFDNMK